MAKSNAVWGIDIGQCALKALRCTVADDGETIVADAFDYIEYPKILSQPDAEPEELVREALEQFLERNELRGDKVAISVPGQNGLSRFFKPPPVDAKKMTDIVKYEARQQIPFALEDVIWDYQQIGGQNVEGFIMDAEVGLFAMKRDQVFRALKPYNDADVEIDIVQLAPLCIYNEICHELLGDVPAPEDIDPDNPPESIVILSMGTDTTDLVITNGIRMWQRSIPLGGNHFTKQLTKELKLTYAKAEHLKRNARQAEDPKTVFQVMRPVFNDLVTEVQRSIGYFQSIDRQAKIGHMVMLGNAVKLPGLRQYLSKNLGQEIIKLDSYNKLSGASVVSSKSFKENMLSFGVCYGLCLQGLGKAKIATNLLPREFLTERLIREKKPWALASVGVLLLALAFNYFCEYKAWWAVHPENAYGSGADKATWEAAMATVSDVKGTSDRLMSRDREQLSEWNHIKALGEEVVGGSDRKLLMLELYRAIYEALPHDVRYSPTEVLDPKAVPYAGRKELHIEYIDSQYFTELGEWFKVVEARYREEERIAAGLPPEEKKADATKPAGGAALDATAADGAAAVPTDATAPAATDGGTPTTPATDAAGDFGATYQTADSPGADTSSAEQTPDAGPQGPGWVVEMKGYHFHNNLRGDTSIVGSNEGGAYVRNSLLKNLSKSKVRLPVDKQGTLEEFTFEELGIGYAVLLINPRPNYDNVEPNWNHPKFLGGGGGARSDQSIPGIGSGPPGVTPMGSSPGAAEKKPETDEPESFPAPKHDFIVQFCWQEQRLKDRLTERQKLRKLQEAQEEAAKQLAESTNETTTN